MEEEKTRLYIATAEVCGPARGEGKMNAQHKII